MNMRSHSYIIWLFDVLNHYQAQLNNAMVVFHLFGYDLNGLVLSAICQIRVMLKYLLEMAEEGKGLVRASQASAKG